MRGRRRCLCGGLLCCSPTHLTGRGDYGGESLRALFEGQRSAGAGVSEGGRGSRAEVASLALDSRSGTELPGLGKKKGSVDVGRIGSRNTSRVFVATL